MASSEDTPAAGSTVGESANRQEHRKSPSAPTIHGTEELTKASILQILTQDMIYEQPVCEERETPHVVNTY